MSEPSPLPIPVASLPAHIAIIMDVYDLVLLNI